MLHSVEIKSEYGICTLTESEIELAVPGLNIEYKFVHISDLHFAVSEPGDSAKEKKQAEESEKTWSIDASFYANKGTDGQRLLSPIETNAVIASRIKEIAPDGVFITGDAMNYSSSSNLKYIEKYFDSLMCRCIFVPGNHDRYGTVTSDDEKIFLRLTDGSPSFRVINLDGLDIVAVDDSDINISEEQLYLTEKQIKSGRPSLLLMHVPVLANAAKEAVWAKWGKGWMIGEEEQSGTNHRFMRLISENSDIIRAVFSGHVHISTGDDEIHGSSIPQYTAAPSFSGFLRVIHVHG